jgi:transketolase
VSTPGTLLRRHAYAIRRDILELAASPDGTHVGGSLSCADILATLYFDVLRVRPEEPDWPERDYFILSKGHASAALYAALAERGFLAREELATYGQPSGRLAGHPLRAVPGVEFSTGSLGHGLSLGIGLALAARMDGGPNRVFVLLGDGELQEGSVWEALMAAAHFQLENLVAIVDRNGLQITGETEECIALEPLDDRLSDFGFAVREVDGHDVEALSTLLASTPLAPRKPSAVLARTTKGRGVGFLEGRKKSHYAKLRPDVLERARASLHVRSRVE